MININLPAKHSQYKNLISEKVKEHPCFMNVDVEITVTEGSGISIEGAWYWTGESLLSLVHMIIRNEQS